MLEPAASGAVVSAADAPVSAAEVVVAGSSPALSKRWLLLTWLLLLIVSLGRSFIPGINEPHYLCKARHWWNPEWCANDFFLQSSNPHLIFYVTFGWLPELVSFPTAAIVARAVCLLILAIGWLELTGPLLKRREETLLVLGLFALLQSLINFSGEWLLGGAESKVISYGFGFWGIGRQLQGKFPAAAILLGLSASFHPLVGVWLTGCALGGYWLTYWNFCRREGLSLAVCCQQSVKNMLSATTLLAGGFWLLCAVPGLWPAVAMLLEPVDVRTKFAGDYLQVFYRLKHHLDPMQFALWRYAGYAAMTAGVAGLYVWERRRWNRLHQPVPAAWRMLIAIVLVSLLIAAIGVLLGARSGPASEMPGFKWRLRLLKFYPFRVYDLLLPLLLSLAIVRTLGQTLFSKWDSQLQRPRWRILCGVLTLVLLWAAIVAPFIDRRGTRMTADQREAWLDVCAWIKQNLPEESEVMTPPNSWAFKWFAQRAEFINFKDCPQDSSGIVEWNRRLLLITRWGIDSYDDQHYSIAETEALAAESGITHILAGRIGPFEQTPIYRNPYFRVYSIAPAE